MPLSDFHPAVRRWFSEQLGTPTEPQARGWSAIRAGDHTLIAAPTGSGKTLAAFLCAIDGLVRQGTALPDATQVLYVSPLKALGNDVQKNLTTPLEQIAALDPAVPDIRVTVRSGDTPQADRARMLRRPPNILVTTPESLYILLTSDGGRAMLSSVRTVIVDEIHAVLGDKRGAHLALSLERLAALCGDVQRIGLSATQKPLSEVGQFLVGTGRQCNTVDAGHLRTLDLAVEVPGSELSAVCSHEVWDEIYDRVVELVEAHRTTLVFVNTRKLAERVAARLTDRLGAEAVTSHHGSLARDRRLLAEQRLKNGELKALVATASLELGIDIGDVDLVVQIGVTPSIAAFLQRVGRAGHGVGRVPIGRIFPLTMDELVCATAVLRSVRRGELDRTPQPAAPLDILAQQVVAACVAETWEADALFERMRRAWPYRELERSDFDAVIALHADGRQSLLHVDGVGGRLRATRRARIPAMTAGGAIPDTADYQVVLQPEGQVVGTLHEDFAIESNVGDIFQLGNTSWRILRVEPGTVRVANAEGLPPTLPFWIAEGPARTRELSASVATVREDPAGSAAAAELGTAAADQLQHYIDAGRAALGTVPTQQRIVLERFFDEADGMQIVVHAPFGGRINRAFGLALRKRFCRHFGFELQAAANEEAFLLSLGPQQSFPLAEIVTYLHPDTARAVLSQALLAAPMFQTRWRWNVTRSLLVSRTRGGKRVPAPLLRFRADDALAAAFPQATACPENLPPGDTPIPLDNPIVRQTVEDCLHEAMDVDGLLQVLQGLRSGAIEVVAIDRPEPSPFAEGILNAQPYAFLDDAPLEERRSQAVLNRRAFVPEKVQKSGPLDPEVVRRVREEAWPAPRDAEELHEALLWMGYARDDECADWRVWLTALAAAGRVVRDGDRWFAAEVDRGDALGLLRGRLEALGPIHSDDPLLLTLEAEGVAVRCAVDGAPAWCNRRLLARIHRYTVERLRQEIAPVAPAQLLRFLACWQHADPEHRLEGPAGVEQVLRQLAGLDAPAWAWEPMVLKARVRDYKKEWLDELTLSGQFAWGRLWGNGACAVRSAPLSVVPREDLGAWLALARGERPELGADAAIVHETLAARGAMFTLELQMATQLLPSRLDDALGELVARGCATSDAFSALRQLTVPASRRRRRVTASGRWSLLDPTAHDPPDVDFIADRLLARYGVLFRALLQRERIPVPWRTLLRELRHRELAGRIRGGRFVTGFDGEQFALPEAVRLLRAQRKRSAPPLQVAAADPLNLSGIVTPEERVSPLTHRTVAV